MIIIDFETRSAVDLKKQGTALYCADPSTDAICMALYNTETLHKQLWYAPDPLPDMMRYALENADLVAAHNAEFDMGIYEYVCVEEYGFPEIPMEKWYCTSAQCRVNALPAALDDAAKALDLPVRKDHRGQQLIKQLSIPQADGLFNRDPALIKEFGEYCMQDVIVTAAIVAATRPMTPDEQEDWLVNVEINERGVKVDLELATLALNYASAEQAEIAALLLKITDGAVERHTQNARIKKWLLGDKLMSPLANEMLVYVKGKAKHSLDKNIRRNILFKYDSGELDITEDQVEVIQLLDDGSKSSVTKFKRMLERADSEDHRVRGAFVFAGASQTLRYASRGLQLHNFKRACWSAEETEKIKTLMRRRALLALTKQQDESVMEALAKLLRPAIIPKEGNVFVVGDWSAIEGMVLPWLANSPKSLKKLERFKRGEDIYISTAKDMGLADNEDSRQIGKVAELALGFCGGKGAFQSMARNYGISITDIEAQNNVDRWRTANPWVWQFGRDLYNAVWNAISHPNTWYEAGRVRYKYYPDMIDGTVVCEIAEGHFIQYPKIQFQPQIDPYGREVVGLATLKAAYKPKADAKHWPIIKIWQGVFAENVTQAFAAALLRNSLRQLDDVVLHTHDEIVMEVPEEYADRAVRDIKEVMLTAPPWAKGLPLKMEPTVMLRYGK